MARINATLVKVDCTMVNMILNNYGFGGKTARILREELSGIQATKRSVPLAYLMKEYFRSGTS